MAASAGVRWLQILVGAALLAACTAPDVQRDPVCGNGRLELGEDCDDGDDDQTDLCLTTCVFASCGDGIVFAQVEACDEGAANSDTGTCKTDCTAQVCGDNHIGPDEDCDDGNDVDTDDCRNDCTLASCGDGFQGPGEDCDDGLILDGDGCSHDCHVELGWLCDGSGCHCAEGQEGADCGACSDGYQDVDGDGLCQPDCTLFNALGGCDVDSHCAIEAGAPTCACNDGLFDQGAGCAPPPTCRVYVASGGSGDGSSWASAKSSLQGGIDAAAGRAEGTLDGRCEVWAAEGTYVVYGNAPTDTLLLRTGVDVHGGFVGTESDLDDRVIDPTTGFLEHESILDGLGACTHVVTGASDALLDGFVVTGGNAAGARTQPSGEGGGLYALDADDLVIGQTTFRDNRGKTGAALFVEGGSLVVHESRFIDNVADWDGGAIGAIDALSLELRDSWFGRNSNLNGWGGALFSRGTGSLVITGSSFSANHARWDGGAIWHAGGTAVVIFDTRIVDSNPGATEYSASGNGGCLGGAMYIRGFDATDVSKGWAAAPSHLVILSIYGSEFLGNEAPYEGGALYLKDIDTVDVSDSSFAGNTAERHNSGGEVDSGGIGGALVGYGLGDVTLTDTQFVCNEAGWLGGAVALFDTGSITADTVTFDTGTAFSGPGGGLYAKGTEGDVVLHEAVFVENSGSPDGGGAYLDGMASVAIQGGAFLDNTSSGYGLGAGLFLRGDFDTTPATVDGTVFEGNDMPGSGSGLSARFLASLDVRRATFADNGNGPSTGGGSGLYASWIGDVTLRESLFEENGLNRDWGPSSLQVENVGTFNLLDSTVRDNLIGDLGTDSGALFLCNDASATLTSAYCNGPTSTNDPATPSDPFDTTAVIARSTFADNESGYAGAHVWAQGIDSLSISDSSFTDGTSQVGGAVWFQYGRALSATGSEFVSNTGRYVGSAISLMDVSGSITTSLHVDDCQFADDGPAPAIRTEGVTDVTIGHSDFVGRGASVDACTGGGNYGNNGEYMGGAVHIKGAKGVSVTDSTFSDLQAQSAGALAIDYGTNDAEVEVLRCSFDTVYGNASGGALLIRGGTTATLEDLTFDDTRSCNAGGAIDVESMTTVTLKDSTFAAYGSKYDSGAAHIVYSDHVLVQDTTFTGPGLGSGIPQSQVGGALLIENGKTGSIDDIVLDGVRVTESSTGSTGGGVKIGGAESVHVVDSVISSNTCNRDLNTSPGWCLGAGLYVSDSGDVVVERSAFLGNTGASEGVSNGQVGAALSADRVHTLTVRASLFSGNEVTTNGTAPTANRGAAIDFRPQVWNSRADPLALLVQGSTLVDNLAQLAPAISIDREFVGDGTTIDAQVVNTIAKDAATAPIQIWSANHVSTSGTVAVTYSDVSGLANTPLHILDVDPLFGTGSGEFADWLLTSASTLRGAGTPIAADAVDLLGTTRADPPAIGALEYVP